MVLKCAGEEDGLRSASLANTFDFLIDLRVFCTDFGVALHGRPFLNRTIDAAATHAGLIACDTGGRRRTSFSRSAVSPADWAVPRLLVPGTVGTFAELPASGIIEIYNRPTRNRDDAVLFQRRPRGVGQIGDRPIMPTGRAKGILRAWHYEPVARIGSRVGAEGIQAAWIAHRAPALALRRRCAHDTSFRDITETVAATTAMAALEIYDVVAGRADE